MGWERGEKDGGTVRNGDTECTARYCLERGHSYSVQYEYEYVRVPRLARTVDVAL